MTQTPPMQQREGTHRSGMSPDGGRQLGRHAAGTDQGFGWVVGWTLGGTLIPGAGLIAAGRRAAGWAVIGLLLLAAAVGAGYLLVQPSLLRTAADLAVSPTALAVLAAVAVALGLLWIAVLITTHVSLRRSAELTGVQRFFSGLLVTALVVAIAAPVLKVGSYAMIQRDLISSVFTTHRPTAGNTPTASPNQTASDPWAATPRVNVLLIGSDAGPDRTGVRTDTLIMASIDTHTGDTVLFSIPRNLYRPPFPAGSQGAKAWPNGFGPVGAPKNYDCGTGADCWINAVWTTASGPGAQYYPNDPNPGLTATEQAVEGTLGLHVDYYAMVNLKGFTKLVDAIGGLTLNVTRPIPIGGHEDAAGNQVGVTGYLHPGVQKLDGYHALWFARSRSDSSDYDRMNRQRCVIGALAKQVDPVTAIKAFPALASTAKENLQTDIPQDQLSAWVDLALRIKDAKIRSLPINDSVVTYGNVDYDKIHRLVQQAINPAPAATSTAAPTPSTAVPAPSASATAAPSSSPSSTDPTVAQDVTAVC